MFSPEDTVSQVQPIVKWQIQTAIFIESSQSLQQPSHCHGPSESKVTNKGVGGLKGHG